MGNKFSKILYKLLSYIEYVIQTVQTKGIEYVSINQSRRFCLRVRILRSMMVFQSQMFLFQCTILLSI